jgi:hypothetical protein
VEGPFTMTFTRNKKMNKPIQVSTLFPSRFLRAIDLGDKDLILTITRIELEDFGTTGHKETKAVLYFQEIDQGFTLNKTNATTLANLYGDDTAGWIGNKVPLYVTDVNFQGKIRGGIRIRMRPSLHPNQAISEFPQPPEEPPDSQA